MSISVTKEKLAEKRYFLKHIRPIVSTSITKQIAEQIRDAIINGDFKRGDQLPTETELAASFGVSRPTIREAFKRLAAQNLIQSRRGPSGGTFVSNFQIEDASEVMISSTMLMLSLDSVNVEDVIDVRYFMELHCCELAIDNWTPGIAESIDDALKRLKDDGLEDRAFCDADVDFHRAIVKASGNRMLEYLMYGVNESLVPVMNMTIVSIRDRSVILECYTELRNALFDRDLQRVETALKALMSYLRERMLEARRIRVERARS